MEPVYIIANLSSLEPRYPTDDENTIPRDQRPSFVHQDRESAEKELLRLASTYPGEFVLFESIATTSKVLTRLGYVERIEPINRPANPHES
jgi:hypothetical protein